MRIAALALALLPGLLPAQEPPSVHFRTLCFQRDAGNTTELLLAGPDGETTEVRLPTAIPSERHAAEPTGGRLSFVSPDAPDKPVATAAVPPGKSELLIMFFPAAPTRAPLIFETVVLDLSDGSLPADGAYIMNACRRDVRVVLGEHRILLKPGVTTGLPRPSERNDFNMAPVVVQYLEDGTWETAAETFARFPPGLQQLFVAFADAGKGRVSMKAYKMRSR